MAVDFKLKKWREKESVLGLESKFTKNDNFLQHLAHYHNQRFLAKDYQTALNGGLLKPEVIIFNHSIKQDDNDNQYGTAIS